MNKVTEDLADVYVLRMRIRMRMHVRVRMP